MNKYDNIINLPHHVSKYRTHLSPSQRASQFAPFSALTGYGDAIKEKEKILVDKIILEDDEKELINECLQKLSNDIKNNPYVTITYFVKDKLTDKGNYLTISGNLKKIDTINNYITLTNNTKIYLDEILTIISQKFNN